MDYDLQETLEDQTNMFVCLVGEVGLGCKNKSTGMAGMTVNLYADGPGFESQTECTFHRFQLNISTYDHWFCSLLCILS